MSDNRRVQRLNSLLREVLSEVIMRDAKDPRLPTFVTVTRVQITSDLRYAKVYVSIMGTPQVKKEALEVLNDAAGFIGITASKKVVMRFFPSLTFLIDETLEEQMKIDDLLCKLDAERKTRSAG